MITLNAWACTIFHFIRINCIFNATFQSTHAYIIAVDAHTIWCCPFKNEKLRVSGPCCNLHDGRSVTGHWVTLHVFADEKAAFIQVYLYL